MGKKKQKEQPESFFFLSSRDRKHDIRKKFSLSVQNHMPQKKYFEA
jgi:hypothetical protein